MITSMASPASERRTRTRDLADVDAAAISDIQLDDKIDAADAYVTLLFGGVPTDGPRLEAAITASNLYASVLICSGIGGPDNEVRIRDQKMQIDDLVQAANSLQESQHKPTVMFTSGLQGNANAYGRFGA